VIKNEAFRVERPLEIKETFGWIEEMLRSAVRRKMGQTIFIEVV
jgi:hypothetical protein